MDKKVDIHKAGGILIRDRKFLVSRSRGKDFFISPGGKLNPRETSEEALARELNEELGVKILLQDLEKFGVFYAPATGQESKFLQLDVFLVHRWGGVAQPKGEIEEIMWIDSLVSDGIKLGSIFQREVLPRLKNEGLID